MKTDSRQRIAVIDYDKCNPKKCGGWYCESVCPVNRAGKQCILHEAEEKPNISEELCIGCLICVNKCPFQAISVINLSMQLDLPIHQYGQNMFRLHRLPLPKKGSVVGLVGRNGLGKSTALNMLSGKLVPNLGNLEERPSWEKVVEKFKGREAQAFFEELSQNRVKVSVKPQNIDLLPKVFSGKKAVGELLKNADETGSFERVVEGLGLESILERRLENLSGGELQKVAIAAASMKKAGFFFFDEPTSYLDIRQRVKVAGFIREIAEKGKSVMAVEHDLIILDYLSDFVHLMYGKPAVFGVVSQVKATKSGVNDYIEGFSKEENYRFRDYAIEFPVKDSSKKKSMQELARWPSFSKTLGGFKLEAKEGSLNRNEVVGVLGENATGKTTFAKVVAGFLEADSGKLDIKLRVSYKPQQLESGSKQTVEEFLREKTREFGTELHRAEILRPLEIEGFLEKRLDTLSGGELQRVAIAGCLGQEADIVLMDEPSAHLDVEQRLNATKAIRAAVNRRNCSAIIIDHDLVFLDYLADRIMFFDGVPSKKGVANSPVGMEQGMNALLKKLGITLRREKNGRPRINKKGSVLDRKQKAAGNYYYS
jgi:ATP-binding cassette subfamily E protein 1